MTFHNGSFRTDLHRYWDILTPFIRNRVEYPTTQRDLLSEGLVKIHTNASGNIAQMSDFRSGRGIPKEPSPNQLRRSKV